MGTSHHRAARNISPVGRRARHALPRDSGNGSHAASDSLATARDILESRCAPIFVPSRPAEITQIGTQIGKDGVSEALEVTMLRIVRIRETPREAAADFGVFGGLDIWWEIV